MSQLPANAALMPSLLDRLTDPDSAGTAWRQGYGVQQMVDAVRADLEELLNTRQSVYGLPPGLAELSTSVLAYGLPDLTSFRATTSGEREAIGRVIEDIIGRFEPRLKEIHVTLVPGERGHEHRVRFHIDAKLNVDPAPEVGFETVVELMSGHASVAPRSG